MTCVQNSSHLHSTGRGGLTSHRLSCEISKPVPNDSLPLARSCYLTFPQHPQTGQQLGTRTQRPAPVGLCTVKPQDLQPTVQPRQRAAAEGMGFGNESFTSLLFPFSLHLAISASTQKGSKQRQLVLDLRASVRVQVALGRLPNPQGLFCASRILLKGIIYFYL